MNSLREQIEDKIFKIIDNDIDEGSPDCYTNVADDILKLIEKRIDELRHTDELEYQDEEVDYGITLFHDKIKKELLK